MVEPTTSFTPVEPTHTPVRCPHCGERKFAPGSALLNTRALSLFNLDWADQSASFLVCAECGRLEWFAQEPQALTAAVP